MSQRRGAMRGDYISSRLSSNGNRVNKMLLWRLFKTQRSRSSAIVEHQTSIYTLERAFPGLKTILCVPWIQPFACGLADHINCTHLSNDVSLASLSCTHMPSVVRLTFWKLLSSDTRWNHLKKTIYVICSYFYRIAFPPSVPSRKPWPDKAPVQTKAAILARIL